LEAGLLLKTSDRVVFILAERKPRTAKYEAGVLSIFNCPLEQKL
jgi:hypothetical protein